MLVWGRLLQQMAVAPGGGRVRTRPAVRVRTRLAVRVRLARRGVAGSGNR